MPRPPAKLPMTREELDNMNSLVTMDNRLYDRDGDPNHQVSAIVEAVTKDTAQKIEKTNLRDLNSVVIVTKEYLKSCLQTGILPSKSGHARALGYSRQAINRFLASHDEHNETAEYLRILYDSFAETLEMASLTNRVHPILSIFILKSIYGRIEHEETPEEKPNSLGDNMNANELVEKYRQYLEMLDNE